MAPRESNFNDLSLAFAEGLYIDYLSDPQSVPEDWRHYFETLNGHGGPKPATGPSFPKGSLFNPTSGNGHAARAAAANTPEMSALQHRVDMLVRNYRVRGHRAAHLDPLGLPQPDWPELDPEYFGFTEEDMARPFSSETVSGVGAMTLGQIVQRMQNTYCRYIGVQFMHIDDLQVRDWLQRRMESTENRLKLSREEQLSILTRLSDAVIFEEFIQKKYTGAKSFSLEGSESLIPLLATAIENAGDHGVNEVVIGMPHRGRLNVLANIMGKRPAEIFREYEDKDPLLHTGRGDVKYHLGRHTTWTTEAGNQLHLALCFNPSHLEYVNPVALGRVRAKQDRENDVDHSRTMTLLIHGDAAFAGEGIVQETLNLSELEGYKTGGTVHVIVNNQVGFTTDPSDSRSCLYATDVAKMLQIPIFHVNGEDPEAVAQAVSLGMEFRQAFKRDLVIDMYCYRRRGHNEGDEPMFTQPVMYRAIKKRKTVRDSYLEHLLTLGEVTAEEAEEIITARREHLEQDLSEARSADERVKLNTKLSGIWSAYRGGPDKEVPEVDTGVPKGKVVELLRTLATVPEDFDVNPKIKRLLDQRKKMARGDAPLDWSAGEALAFASLATSGARVRMTGQDSQRGTFSHRHGVLHDMRDGSPYYPLQNLSEDQAPVDIYNSPLSEAGVLGFEYGYSLGWPEGLTIWEAQFGDFHNAAQVIIDQFLSSAEDKWRSLCGLVMLLPHGFEGMGPEHSSARLERFLGLAAEDNIQVVVPTTPAQIFHALRRQVVRTWRKPLVVMTPKSLLRHPRAISDLSEFTQGRFRRMLPDEKGLVQGVKRILLCSGKIYYELAEERDRLGRSDIAILRVEQLYPLQPPDLDAVLAPYAERTPIYWVQEEPENMGAWRRMKGKFGVTLLDRFPFTVVCRPASASPATGSSSSHKIEQREIIDRAFGDEQTSWF
jgi:2-oxoglutarate dehydrogenase E1 component